MAGACPGVGRSAGWLVVVFLLAGCQEAGAPDVPAPDGWASIAGQRIALEIARTPEEQRLGLGERDALAWDRGMLFVYETPGFPRFWMKGMRFDIDIVWIREGRIVEISHRVRHVPGENGPVVAPRSLADTVLEVPAGYARTRAWRPGQRVEIEIVSPAR